jgi:putative ABC transport system substrate-binding protein
MRRREFIAGLAGTAAWPIAADAQQGDRVRRIGVLVLTAEDDPQGKDRTAALEQELEKLGWRVGRNLQINYRWGIVEPERARTSVIDLLRSNPEVVVADATAAARAAQQATGTVPIVFRGISEPLTLGFVASLSHPGGNITGFANFEPTIGSKWLELLKEIAPRVKRAAFMFNPDANPAGSLFYSTVEAAAAKLAVETTIVRVRQTTDIESGLAKLNDELASGLIVPADQYLTSHRELVLDLTARYRLPAVYPFDYFARDGGLLSYGPEAVDQFRKVATYVDRILRGEKPADLPVQQPTKFELLINLKTAKTLGLSVPETLLATADELIQ